MFDRIVGRRTRKITPSKPNHLRTARSTWRSRRTTHARWRERTTSWASSPIELTQTALDLCQAQGDRYRQAALHNNLANLLHQAGQSEQAMEHLKQAVAIFADIGEETGALQPEIWKLVEW